ncbi:MAG: MFS transporter [Desulfarculus sp.]|nr:MFS transporter [Desulfarculus sp.]
MAGAGAAAVPTGQEPRLSLVFALVAAAFTTIYLPQPVLPVLQREFGVSPSVASLTVSAVVLGLALANLPFGMLSDRLALRPLILAGGLTIAGAGLFCAATHSLTLLVAARLVQGLFLPALTTCLAAYLAKSLALERLNVAMGSYVSATVAGGLLGRLLGGFLHPPLHWRYAFVTASLLLLLATLAAAAWLPPQPAAPPADKRPAGFKELLLRPDLLRNYLVAFGAFFVFSSVFNYLPFYLSGPPFHASTRFITMLYLSYLLGIVIGPLAGRISNRLGNGVTMACGSALFACAVLLSLVPALWAVLLSLAGVCLGFFAVHAAAAGALNRRLSGSQGRANSLYVLFYYLGGTAGITLSGQAYALAGWPAVVAMGVTMLTWPLGTGLWEARQDRRAGRGQ